MREHAGAQQRPVIRDKADHADYPNKMDRGGIRWPPIVTRMVSQHDLRTRARMPQQLVGHSDGRAVLAVLFGGARRSERTMPAVSEEARPCAPAVLTMRGRARSSAVPTRHRVVTAWETSGQRCDTEEHRRRRSESTTEDGICRTGERASSRHAAGPTKSGKRSRRAPSSSASLKATAGRQSAASPQERGRS